MDEARRLAVKNFAGELLAVKDGLEAALHHESPASKT